MQDSSNQKFNRLLALFPTKDYKYNCLCDCGNYKEVIIFHLKNNKIRSCGCLNNEIRSKRFANYNKKFNSKLESVQNIVYQTYIKNINDNITFNDFLKLSQQNCYYCNCLPNKTKNKYNTDFIYNGLDRIDSNKYHTIDNLVPCCQTCNSMKQRLTQLGFYDWAHKIQFSEFDPITLNNQNYSSIYINNRNIATVKKAYSLYREISIDNFIELSQKNCFYCKKPPSNKCKRFKKTFIYNGLDRINSNKTHSLDNVVPCCKVCNFAKNTLSLQEFYDHVKKIKNFFTFDKIIYQ